MFVPGEIVIAAFPFTTLTGAKRRPCLVLAAGDSSGDFLVAFITSNLDWSRLPSATSVVPAHPGWRQTGLKVASAVRADKLVTLIVSERLPFAVAGFYAEWRDLSDDEVLSYLNCQQLTAI